MLLRERHLIPLAADGDQREALLRRPRAHHLGDVLVVRRQLHLATSEIVVVVVRNGEEPGQACREREVGRSNAHLCEAVPEVVGVGV